MELTRRDALTALAASGIAIGTTSVLDEDEGADSGEDEKPLTGDEIATLTAAASALYPSQVSDLRSFVETYAVGRVDGRDGYRRGMRDALATLDDRATEWYGNRYASLSTEDRDQLLRQVGADTADPNPDGSAAERIRYYVVNELLYALYTTDVGGKLVGIENPQGHPGGLDSYQRGPNE